LPKRLTQPPAQKKEKKERTTRESVNPVVLRGTIGPSGVEVTNSHTGVPCASFTLEVQEQGRDGQASSKLIPCKLFGAKAESAVELEAGQLVRVEGKLKKRQKGDQWELIGSGFEVTPVLAPTSASELPGSNERVPEA
jgi:single-stranded DNA-binding protein